MLLLSPGSDVVLLRFHPGCFGMDVGITCLACAGALVSSDACSNKETDVSIEDVAAVIVDPILRFGVVLVLVLAIDVVVESSFFVAGASVQTLLLLSTRLSVDSMAVILWDACCCQCKV